MYSSLGHTCGMYHISVTSNMLCGTKYTYFRIFSLFPMVTVLHTQRCLTHNISESYKFPYKVKTVLASFQTTLKWIHYTDSHTYSFPKHFGVAPLPDSLVPYLNLWLEEPKINQENFNWIIIYKKPSKKKIHAQAGEVKCVKWLHWLLYWTLYLLNIPIFLVAHFEARHGSLTLARFWKCVCVCVCVYPNIGLSQIFFSWTRFKIQFLT